MYKNQLQELAQRSCFNLPSYSCVREGPDHAPRFKASVNFNGEIFQSPGYCSTLRQAEHAAAEAALNALSTKGPARSLTARVLDETGVYKNLLQETAHRAGLKLPAYTTVRSGPAHVPVFTSTVELAGMSFTGEPAKTKKQAEKNAAIAAWAALRTMPSLGKEKDGREVQDQVVATRALLGLRPREEAKVLRKKRRVLRVQKDGGGGSCSSSAPQERRLVTASLLPSPPPPAASNILTPGKATMKRMDEKDRLGPTTIPKLSSSSPPSCARMAGAFPPRNLAPAVQIRSVVPVCAAPPPTNNSPTPSPSTNPSSSSTSRAFPSQLISELSKLQF